MLSSQAALQVEGSVTMEIMLCRRTSESTVPLEITSFEYVCYLRDSPLPRLLLRLWQVACHQE